MTLYPSTSVVFLTTSTTDWVVVRLHHDYDFNVPPGDDGHYRVLPNPLADVRRGQRITFGMDGMVADGRVVDLEVGHGGGTLLVVERTSDIRCRA